MEYLKKLMGWDAIAITPQQKISIHVRMISGEVLTTFHALSPSLLMRDLQQRLAAEFPDLGHFSMVVGQECASGDESIADLVNDAQLMESSTPQMTVYVIRRPSPVLHVRDHDFGIDSDEEELEDCDEYDLNDFSYGRIMIKDGIVYSGLESASTLARGIAESVQIYLDKAGGIEEATYSRGIEEDDWYYRAYKLRNAIVISNPLKDATKETCLEALGIVERYRSNADVIKWEIAHDIALYEADASYAMPIPMLRLMLGKLSCHFIFGVPRDRPNDEVSPIIFGGFDVEGNIIGVLGNEGGDLIGVPWQGY